MTSGALSATSPGDEGEPVPARQHIDRFSNGYDPEVEEPAPHHYPRAAEVEKPAKSWWDLVTSEWRAISALIMPLLVGGGILLIPASKSQVDAVKIEAAANLEVAKTDIQGQVKGVHIEVDNLKSTVVDLRGDVKEIGRDLKVLLSRSQTPQQADAAPVDASPPVSPAPNPSQTIPPKKSPKTVKRVEKPAQSSSLPLWPFSR